MKNNRSTFVDAFDFFQGQGIWHTPFNLLTSTQVGLYADWARKVGYKLKTGAAPHTLAFGFRTALYERANR